MKEGVQPPRSYEQLSRDEREALLDNLYRKVLTESGRKCFKPGLDGDYRRYFVDLRENPQIEKYLKDFDKLSRLLHRDNQTRARAHLRDHPWILDHSKKIHLQPKVDDVPNTVADLFSLVTKNEEVNQQVHSFKVLVDDFPSPSLTPLGNVFIAPIVVVYLMHDASPDPVIEAFRTHFQGYQPTPDDFAPRFNQRVDGVVFYAEGEGFLKFLMERDIRGCYYDPTTNYALARKDPEHLPPSIVQRVVGRIMSRPRVA